MTSFTSYQNRVENIPSPPNAHSTGPLGLRTLGGITQRIPKSPDLSQWKRERKILLSDTKINIRNVEKINPRRIPLAERGKKNTNTCSYSFIGEYG